MESENAFQTLCENIPGIVYRVFIRENNRMQFFNNLIESMTGYGQDELTSGEVCSIEPMIIPEDRPEVIAAVKNAVAENRPFQVEYRLRRKDGDVGWFLERGRPVNGEDGKPLYIDGVIFNVDDRKHAEESALLSHKRLEAVKEIGGLATSTYDLETALQRILKGTIDATSASAGMVFLKDLETGSLSWASSIGLSEAFVAEYENRHIRPGEGLTGQIAQTGELIYIPEGSSHDPRIARPVVEAEGLNSFIGVPFYAHGDIIGVMNIVSKPPGLLAEKECLLCAAVGAYVGTAIHNTQLFHQQEQAKEALRKREQYFRSLLDNMHEDIVVIDRDFQITDVNRSFVAGSGYKREEVIGRHCFEISHGYQEPCEKHGEECRVGEVFKTGKPCIILHEHRNADGSKAWHDGLLSPLLNEEGEATYVIEAMRNVTDLVEARKRLEESERHYRTLFNNASEAIFIHDTAERFLEVNQVACDRLGYEHEDFSKMTVSDLDSSEFSGTLSERMDKLLQLKHIIFESAHVAKNGNRIPVEVSSRLIDYAGKPAVLSMVRDISERKQAEEEKEKLEDKLRQAQKMEAVGTLAGGIAHDFNNILAAIIGLSELAMMEVPEGSTLHRHIEQVLASGMRAKDLVKQILAFSRQGDQQRIPMSIYPVVNEALSFVRSSLPTTIEINQYLEKDSGLIEGDPTQIHQVLMNLCTNAEHAMREKGGVLEVKVRKVECGVEMEEMKTHLDLHPGTYVLLSVSDTGYGMDAQTRERIFDPYFTTKGVGEGTGLGLAVVQGIVHKWGGAVTVESEVGKGTTFQVYFPAIEGEKEEIQEKDQKPMPTGTERILFVDDEEILAEVGNGILEQLGYEVTVRTSSLEALELFKAKPKFFDLVIMDMSMPNMTGAELSQELMRIRPGIPIILCTGFSHIISKEKAREIGIRAFVMKPLIRKDLAETVRRVLDEKNAIDV